MPNLTQYINRLKLLKNKQRKFNSYNEALKYCSVDAYEKTELIDVILKKTIHFKSTINNNVIPVWETSAYSLISILNPALENANSKTINVLDFGGACGAHYFHLRALIDTNIKLNWVVVETNTMVNYAKNLETEELKFTSTFSEAVSKLGSVDLIHTSGTLQCVDDPHKYLAEMLGIDARWLLFNRLGLNKIDRDVITIHKSKLSWNGIGELPEGYEDKWIKYPFVFMSEKKFYDQLQKKYSVIAKFDDKTGMFDVAGEKIVGYGLLCKKMSQLFYYFISSTCQEFCYYTSCCFIV